jgi:hypothetical protein
MPGGTGAAARSIKEPLDARPPAGELARKALEIKELDARNAKPHKIASTQRPADRERILRDIRLLGLENDGI